MILDQLLTAQQRAVSQHNFNMFNIINGFSYMCLGETVLILLAVQIKCEDWVVATLGAMLFIGFLLLPLGRVVTAQVGAAKAQANFWVARNFAALLVGSSAVLYYGNMPISAIIALLLGSFLFYGFRAAGVVMAQPLIGEITTDEDRGRLVAYSGGFFYAACFIALIAITVVLRIGNSSHWTLPGIIVVGAVLGCTASRFLAKIDETSAPRDSARRPIWPELRAAWNNPALRQQFGAGFAVNVAIILLIPVSMMALKKGFGVSDDQAMYFALCQFAACAVMSFLTGKISAKIGPRRLLLVAYLCLLLLGIFWQIVPSQYCGLAMAPIFLFAGATMVAMNNSNVHYFLQTISEDQRVTSSMLLSVFTGFGAGVVGTGAAAGLLKIGKVFYPAPESLLDSYRLYFLAAAVLLAGGIWLIARLKPLPEELRPIKEEFIDAQYGNRMNYARSSQRLFSKNDSSSQNKEE